MYLGAKSDFEIAEAAIADRLLFKFASRELANRNPDQAAALRLVAAYERGEAEPWVVAHLLGQVGHRCGYQTVKDILITHHDRGAGSYAGPAMARIAGREALEDLRHLMFEAKHARVRRGAGHGLATFRDSMLIPDFVRALLQGRLPISDVTSHVIEANPGDETLLAWLEADEPRLCRLAGKVIAELMSSQSEPDPGSAVVRRAREIARQANNPFTRYAREYLADTVERDS